MPHLFPKYSVVSAHIGDNGQTFLDDVRLADAEVIREPYGPNPGVISSNEAEALAEHLSSMLAPSVPRVVA